MKTIEINAVIDREKLSPLQWLVFALGFLVFFCDGLDTGIIGFIAFRRAGSDGNFEGRIADLRARGANIIIMPDEIIKVSSTKLRQNLKQHKNEGFIPENIYRYITEKGIYDASKRAWI